MQSFTFVQNMTIYKQITSILKPWGSRILKSWGFNIPQNLRIKDSQIKTADNTYTYNNKVIIQNANIVGWEGGLTKVNIEKKEYFCIFA